MSYAICRIQKLKGNGFAKAFKHNCREYDNSVGVDKSKEHLNIFGGKYCSYIDAKKHIQAVTEQIQANTDRKLRKDTVTGVEVIFASDTEFLSNEYNMQEYFKNAQEWLVETFGEENLLSYTVHFDEDGAPHMHAILTTCVYKGGVPVKFDVKQWVNDRQSLVKIQDSWHSKVKHLGLERGISAKFTHNTHKTKAEYAKLLEKDLKEINKLSDKDREILALKGLRAERKELEMQNSLQRIKDLSEHINGPMFTSLAEESQQKIENDSIFSILDTPSEETQEEEWDLEL